MNNIVLFYLYNFLDEVMFEWLIIGKMAELAC